MSKSGNSELILKEINKDLKISKETKFIEELYENRIMEIQGIIINNAEYENTEHELKEIKSKLYKMLENNIDIIKLIEEYQEVSSKLDIVYEKIIYKIGIHDGISFIKEGIGSIDIKENINNITTNTK